MKHLEIHFHAHRAKVSPAMRKRAERMVVRAAERIPRVVSATIRFEEDGPVRRVSLALHAPRHHDLMGRAEGRFFGPSLVSALARIMAQAAKERKGLAKSRGRRLARAGT